MACFVCGRRSSVRGLLVGLHKATIRPACGGPARPRSDSDAGIARAGEAKLPILILVIEGKHDDDGTALAFASQDASHPTARIVLDISNSRNRATATRFHVPDLPVLLCLSPRGLIVSRDEGPITKDLVLKRIDQVIAESPQLDSKLGSLEAAVARGPDDITAQLQLADFLVIRHNAREAIPHLEFVATASRRKRRSASAFGSNSFHHLWISEPEKGRHEAKDLIATLSPRSAEARAGGMLVLGTQDAAARRATLARQELEEAIAAAPGSTYANEAAAAIAKLPPLPR